MGVCISICFDDDENDNTTKKNRRSIPNRPIQQQRKEPIKRIKNKEKIVTDQLNIHSRNNSIGNDNYEQYKQLNTHSRNNSIGNDNYEHYKQQQQQSSHYPIKPYDLNNSSSIARINETNKAASSSVILSTLNFNTTPNGNGVKAGLTKEDKQEISFLYKMAAASNFVSDRNNNTDQTAASNTTDDEFRDNLNNLYLAINDNTNGNNHDNNSNDNDIDINTSNDIISTNNTHDVTNKKVFFKTEKEFKTEKVLRNIHLQYSDISPSPLKGYDNVNNDIVSKYHYNVELERKQKRNSVKNMQLERLSSARMTIPENISFVDKS